MAIIGSQKVLTPDDSSQPRTSGVKEGEISLRPMTDTFKVYQRTWKKLISCKGFNPDKTIIEISKKYNRVWMLEGSKPDVRE
ncbi:UNVERIFIED_CONTAM: hypothetical protein Sangu_2667900 [Sesamum angustifolium]|uniref:Uncharacterized protein n=1 Tax=Sesamum angustifolium TaxID=2727405 RepID=A0AAW2J1B3_9LAMI